MLLGIFEDTLPVAFGKGLELACDWTVVDYTLGAWRLLYSRRDVGVPTVGT
jgi:hypothetical protein